MTKIIEKQMTIAQKILARACSVARVAIGEVVYPKPVFTIVHDGYVETVHKELAALGYGQIRNPDSTVFVTDHEVAYGSQKAVIRGRAIRNIAQQWRIGHFYDAGRGGHGHLLPIENGMIQPGQFVFAYDMHATNFGAVGCFAIGVGVEIATVLATGTLWTAVPQTIRIDLHGELQIGVHARDVGFLLANGLSNNRWNTDHDYRVIEFGGPGLAHLDLSQRVALCNSITELGVTSVLFETPDCEDCVSDPDAEFQARIAFDLSEVEPQVALPGGPERAASVRSVENTRIDHAFIGACGSGLYEDFAAAASYLRGKQVAPHVRMFVVPGTPQVSRRLADEGILQVFMDAGAIQLPSGCGPCAGGLMAPLGSGEVSISTAATNHEGRMGPADGQCYLGSPLTVAVSAVEGRIADPRTIR